MPDHIIRERIDAADLINFPLSPDLDLLVAKIHPQIAARIEHFAGLWASTLAANDAKQANYQTNRKALVAAKIAKDDYLKKMQRGAYGVDAEIVADHNLKISASEARLKKTQSAGGARFAPAWQDLETFLKRFKPAQLKPAEIPALVGKSSMAQLDHADEAVEAAKIALAAAESAPRTVEEAVSAARKQIAKMREAGAPNLKKLFHRNDFDNRGQFEIKRGGGTIRFPSMTQKSSEHENHFNVPLSFEFMAWYFGDEFEAKIVASIESTKPKGGTTAEQKVAAVAAAQINFVAALRMQDAALIALETQGIFRRKRALHPAVHLGVEYPAVKIISAL